ncbi:unnamed protein product [Rotaria sp. Silwood2]|nr:unnamed protein product [Rotaria sp. Silwood2]CAF4150624.1 unnamed protein product [Rotaria sp. Silwood2]CAF4195377.1 unnamed protein product [Rotaria sp. Silwood2]CAF4680406.1 unnamed protein product [Rotaria sp. Silwood2]
MGTIVFGETTCGQAADQICGAGGLFIDRQGAIYYSDSSNHRILKITPFVSTAVIVAGTNGSSGSMTNQLNNPGGIYVDTNGTLQYGLFSPSAL